MLMANSQYSSAIVSNDFLSVTYNKKWILESAFLIPLLFKGSTALKTLFFFTDDSIYNFNVWSYIFYFFVYDLKRYSVYTFALILTLPKCDLGYSLLRNATIVLQASRVQLTCTYWY